MKKILILNNYYYPNMEGGAEFSIKMQAEALAEIGYDVNVLSMDGSPDSILLAPDIINGVKIYRVYSKPLYRRRILNDKTHFLDKIINGIHSIYNPRMDKGVQAVIEKIQPDIIHTQNMVSMSYRTWKFANKKAIPVVHTLRDYWLIDPTTNINQFPLCFDVFFRAYHRKLSNKYINIVTSPSDKTLEIFDDFGYFKNCKHMTIVNAIHYDERLLETCLTEKKNRKDEVVHFMFAGKVTYNKGIKILVDAFINSGVNAYLSICGSGDLDEWISKKNNLNIIQLGKMSQKKLFEEYRKADVLIVPSLWDEPFGRIVIEGAQYGLPIIGSNKGGIPEIIQTLEYGEVYNAEKVEELSDLIKKYSNRNFLRTCYQKGPQNLEKYGVEKLAYNFDCVYKTLRKNGD